MTNYDVAQKVVSYFDKKTKTSLSEDLLNILLTVSDTVLENPTTREHLHEEQNEYHALCYVYQEWQRYFLIVSNIRPGSNHTRIVAAGVNTPMSPKDVQEGLSLFQEIDALNVFEASNPPPFLSI